MERSWQLWQAGADQQFAAACSTQATVDLAGWHQLAGATAKLQQYLGILRS